jgi:hypothetical protein
MFPATTEFTSSNIAHAGYNSEWQILQLIFSTGGTYWYFNFLPADWELFCQAESKGKHFHKFIKSVFPYMKAHEHDLAFDAVLIANTRHFGSHLYRRFGALCEIMGWDFIEAWDKALYRSIWLENQPEQYRADVLNSALSLTIIPPENWPVVVELARVEPLDNDERKMIE